MSRAQIYEHIAGTNNDLSLLVHTTRSTAQESGVLCDQRSRINDEEDEDERERRRAHFSLCS